MVYYCIVNAADYDMPQHRRRVLIIGKRCDILYRSGNRINLHMAAIVGAIFHPRLVEGEIA